VLRRRFPILRFRRVTVADFAQVVLAFVTVFLLLASPVVTYEFKTNDELLLWTCLLAAPAAVIGIVLNHLATAE